MKAAVFYATREGHASRIAQRVAIDLRARGAEVDLFDVRTPPAADWAAYSAACVVASVHAGHHEREMIAFAAANRAHLDRLGAAFLSVTLSETTAENPAAPVADREKAAADVQHVVDVFVKETAWRPAHVLPVAGALAHSRYNFIVRFVMKQIARKAGAPTDTSRDYEFTNWPSLDSFVAGIAAEAERRAASVRA